MTKDNEQNFKINDVFTIRVVTYKEPDVFNQAFVIRFGRIVKQYWSPLKPCLKNAKHFLKKYQDKNFKYSNAQKAKSKNHDSTGNN